MLPAALFAFALLPLVVAAIFSAIAWYSVPRPMLFAVAGTIEGYVVAAVVLYWALLPLTTIGISGASSGGTPAGGIAPFHRLLIGIPIAVTLHLLVLWGTHRAMLK